MDLPTLDAIDASTLPERVRDGLDCVDCGKVAPPIMRPVGRVYGQGDDQGWQVFSCCRPADCNGPEDCTRSPHLGCLCRSTGTIVKTECEYRSDALEVVVSEYTKATVWLVIYGHKPLTEDDAAYLDGINGVAAESGISWTANVSTTATPGARLHAYVTLI